MTEIGPVPEKIVERKVVVYKTLVDPSVAKITGEKSKDKLFVRLRFLRPKPEEVQYVSVDKYYEPYIAVNGKYTIDYYRKQAYTLKVDERVRQVILFNQTFKPETLKTPTKKAFNEIKFEGEERLFYEDKAYVILDKKGREVTPEQVPSAPSEDEPEKILAEFSEKMGRLQVSPDMEIGIIRSKIVKRPSDIKRVVRELFEVSERTIIYTPIYEVAFKNTRTGGVKTLKIDGVTTKMILQERKPGVKNRLRNLWRLRGVKKN